MKKIILVAGLIAASGTLIADDFILDYEFADGEIASGAEVNANFQALEGKANEHDVDATYNNAVLGSGLTNLQYSIVDCTQELGQYNTAVGVGAIDTNVYGSSNTAMGYSALANMTPDVNAMFTSGAGCTIGGDQNTAVGALSGAASTLATGQTSVGYSSLDSMTGNVSPNTAIGAFAMSDAASGGFNTAVGYAALALERTVADNVGDWNTAVGNRAMSRNINGTRNTAVGAGALASGVGNQGSYNVAIGFNALGSNDGDPTVDDVAGCEFANGYLEGNGSANVGIGYAALGAVDMGCRNTAVGHSAGPTYNGGSEFVNTTALGYEAEVTQSNQIALGNDDIETVVTAGTLTLGQITYPNVSGNTDQVLVTNGTDTASWVDVSTLPGVAMMTDELTGRIAELESRLEEQQEYLLAVIEAQQEQIAALERVVSMDQFAAR